MIDDLIAALKVSPGNIPFKAIPRRNVFFTLERYQEAEKEYLEALAVETNEKELAGTCRLFTMHSKTIQPAMLFL